MSIPIPAVTNYKTIDPNTQTSKDLIAVFKNNTSIITPAPFSTGYKEVGGYDLSQIFVPSANSGDQISYNTNYDTSYNGIKDLRYVFQKLPIYEASGNYTDIVGSNNWNVIQFTNGGGSIIFEEDVTINYLLVGAGGKGGNAGPEPPLPFDNAGGGGGGGGGVVNSSFSVVQNTTYTIGVSSAVSTAFGTSASIGNNGQGGGSGGAGGTGGAGGGSGGAGGTSITGAGVGAGCPIGNIPVNPSGSNLNLTYSVGNGGGGGGELGAGGYGGGQGGQGGNSGVFSGGGGGGGGFNGGNGGNGGDGPTPFFYGGNGGKGGVETNVTLAANAVLSFGNGGGGGGGSAIAGFGGGAGGAPSNGCVVIWFQYP